MNKERRKKVKEVLREIDILKSVIEEIRDEECDAYENLPDNLKRDQMEEYIDAFDEAIDNITNAEEYLEEVL